MWYVAQNKSTVINSLPNRQGEFLWHVDISFPFPCWWSILKCCLLFVLFNVHEFLWLLYIIPSLFLVGKLFCSSVGYQSGSGSAGGRDLPGADIIASWSVTLIRPYFSQRDHYQEPEETQECLQLPPLSQGSWVRREEFAGFAQKLGQTVLVLEVSNLDQEHCTPAVSWPWNSTEASPFAKSQSFCLQISQKYLCMNVHMKWKYPKITCLLSLLSKRVCVNKGVSRYNWSGLTYPNACTDLPAGAVLACTSLSFCLYVHLTSPRSLVIPRQVHPNTCKWQGYPLSGHLETIEQLVLISLLLEQAVFNWYPLKSWRMPCIYIFPIILAFLCTGNPCLNVAPSFCALSK